MIRGGGRAARGSVLAGLAALALVTSACTPPATTPTPSPRVSSPSASATPDLTRAGRAAAAVKALTAKAGTLPIIKVDITADTASLSAVDDGRVVAWQWQDGVITSIDSDIEYVKQASFSPDDFALKDLGALFATAAEISGSASNQELQIVDYNAGQVLMTVTTRPESMPVFFRRDGTPINRLDFTSTPAFSEAIRDVAGGNSRVLAMGWSASEGMWADVPGSEPGVVTRTTRQAKVPTWTSSRKADSTGLRFAVRDVDPAVLARLVVALPKQYQTSEQNLSFTIQRRGRMVSPVIEWTVGGQRVVTTLSGNVITDQLP